MSDTMLHHLGEDEMLLYMDQELSRRQRARAREHVKGCWQCRAHLDEIETTVAEFIRYQEKLFAAETEAGEWPDLRPRMQMAAEREAPSHRVGTWRRTAILAFALATAVLAYVLVIRREAGSVPPPRLPSPSPRSASGPAAGSSVTPSPRVERTLPKQIASPDDPVRAEIAALAALHQLDADLGEPIDLTRTPGGGVTVIARGLPSDREQQIAQTLAAIPGVAVRFEQPSERPTGPGSQPPLSITAAYTPLEAKLERTFGSRNAVEEFANLLLAASDETVTRAHALHNLEERFPQSRFAGLTADQRAAIDRIANDHRAALATHLRGIHASLDRVQHALGRGDGPSSPLPAASLLDSALRLDRALNIAFAGAEGSLTVPQLLAEFDESIRQLDAALERSK
jgi:hypothetical protein